MKVVLDVPTGCPRLRLYSVFITSVQPSNSFLFACVGYVASVATNP